MNLKTNISPLACFLFENFFVLVFFFFFLHRRWWLNVLLQLELVATKKLRACTLQSFLKACWRFDYSTIAHQMTRFIFETKKSQVEKFFGCLINCFLSNVECLICKHLFTLFSAVFRNLAWNASLAFLGTKSIFKNF